MLERLERPEPIDHPVTELLKVAAEVRQWQVILRERLAELSTLELEDVFRAERERAVVVLYERSLDRAARVLTDLLKLDLSARALSLQEAQAKKIMAAIIEAIRRTGLGDHERQIREQLAVIFREAEASSGVG